MTRTATPAAGPAAPVALRHGLNLGAWLTLYRLSVAQFVRGRRLLALAGLFLLPVLLVLIIRYFNPDYQTDRDGVEEAVVFFMIPQALVPLSALILASGMVRDEVENQTLTYLLVRPLPRPSIYVAKWLAAWSVATGLAAVFVAATLAAIHCGREGFWGAVFPGKFLGVAGLSALALMVYTAVFGALGMVVRWVLPVGVAYIAVFEGVFANIDFAVRRLTVLWYVRTLAARWLGLNPASWGIELDLAPGSREALLTLVTATLVLVVGAAVWFGRSEIRVKTPEGG